MIMMNDNIMNDNEEIMIMISNEKCNNNNDINESNNNENDINDMK